MSARRQTRLAAVSRQPDAASNRQSDAPHYLNRQWQYHPSTTHGDSSAFRARLAEYAKRTRQGE